MAQVKGGFVEILRHGRYRDDCSRLRHWLANRGIVEHSQKYVPGLEEAWREAYRSHPHAWGSEYRGGAE